MDKIRSRKVNMSRQADVEVRGIARLPTCCGPRLTCWAILVLTLVVYLGCCQQVAATSTTTLSSIINNQKQQQQQQQQQVSFPGVSRDLASFCAARPSLPIDLASMVVHVKKNVSFNYKLYLFSTDHVFQTGQVIPRDDFRIHSFPVKFKRLQEFWPPTVTTFHQNSAEQQGPQKQVRVPSSQFDLKQFLQPVPLNPTKITKQINRPREVTASRNEGRRRDRARQRQHSRLPEDAHSSALPGDREFVTGASYHVSTEAERSDNFNKHIQFDRDDQLSIVGRSKSLASPDELASESLPLAVPRSQEHEAEPKISEQQTPKTSYYGDLVTPVGSFSSFHVNLTYLVRKDFGQVEPQLVRILVDAHLFQVTEVLIIGNRTDSSEDYNFLNHKLLRDPNTRITAINQIYEDWITRNFYTVVYIQRRLETGEVSSATNSDTIVTDRLVFRGASLALLGADQLDYNVKAAAFITEKNGLHYYMEFLNTGKFYLCAVDWTKRPFKIIDSRRFPIKATRTQLDNEELLLCPPAVCYSNQPIDELIGYGRLSLPDRIQKQTLILSASHSSTSSSSQALDSKLAHGFEGMSPERLNETVLVYSKQKNSTRGTIGRLSRAAHDEINAMISLDDIVDAIRQGSGQIQTRLHLRDWIWNLSRSSSNHQIGTGLTAEDTIWPIFEWHYEQAKRNDIKVRTDTYGYVLTGHEIDASYRVYNELYLISSDHLITINYTMSNETVTSSHPLGDEFVGLSSTLIDPITGAFYDRYLNQIFFFKGDRYVGFDYATKKPLDDFLLQTPDELQESISGPLISSLPVVGILGRQHQVDGIYHDLAADVVFIFTGMKFYTFKAGEFKNGSFKPESGSLPKMHCINERFLQGCNFDEAFRNPCQSELEPRKVDISKSRAPQESAEEANKANTGEEDQDEAVEVTNSSTVENKKDLVAISNVDDFNEEQQMKLRSIASKASILDLLVEKSLMKKKNKGEQSGDLLLADDRDMANLKESGSQDKITIYLLMALVALTALVSVVLIAIMLNWSRLRGSNETNFPHSATNQAQVRNRHLDNEQQHRHKTRRHQYYQGGSNLTPLPSNLAATTTTTASDQLTHHHHNLYHSRQQQQLRPLPKPLGAINALVSKGRRSSNVDNSAL